MDTCLSTKWKKHPRNEQMGAKKCLNLPNVQQVVLWSTVEVSSWLRKVQLEDCIEAFTKREIGGSKLLELTDQELLRWKNELKIKHKMKIMKYVRDCKNQQPFSALESRKLSDGQLRSPSISTSDDLLANVSKEETNSRNVVDGYHLENKDNEWDTDFDEESDDDDPENTHKADNASAKVTGNIRERIVPKPPDSKPPATKYPMFVPMETIRRNKTSVRRPQSIPPPPPLPKPTVLKAKDEVLNPPKTNEILNIPNVESEEGYEIPNNGCNDHKREGMQISDFNIHNFNANSSQRLSAEEVSDTYESLDDHEQHRQTIKIPEVPPEVVPCTPSPSSRLKANENGSPSLPPRSTKNLRPNLRLPPPIPELLKTPLSEDISSMLQASNVVRRPLPLLPPTQLVAYSDVHDSKITENTDDLLQCSWYHALERNEAEKKLKKEGSSGSYLIRESRRGGECNPYTLTILFNENIYHLNIRRRDDGAFALGSHKLNEMTFATLTELVETHQTDPILLSSKGKIVGQTCLINTIDKFN